MFEGTDRRQVVQGALNGVGKWFGHSEARLRGRSRRPQRALRSCSGLSSLQFDGVEDGRQERNEGDQPGLREEAGRDADASSQQPCYSELVSGKGLGMARGSDTHHSTSQPSSSRSVSVGCPD